MFRLPGRFMRLSTASEACCSGRSMYLQTFVAVGHRRQRVLVDRRGVEVEQPDPLQAVDGVQLAKQPRQRAALAAIDAVEGRVLRDQQQFLTPRAARARASRTIESGGPVPIVAAQRRDDAERALVVAAFGNLDVGVVLRALPGSAACRRRRCTGRTGDLGFGMMGSRRS